jgi:hypothetical protein
MRRVIVVALSAFVLAPVAERQAECAPALRPGLEAHLGAAWNSPAPLTVRQDGQPDLALTAHYETHALELPMYYVYRVLLLDDSGRGWSLDLVHDKLYLKDPPAAIGEFAVSHGYNLLTLSRLGRRRPWHWGAGMGAVVTHPENTVRGLKLSEKRGPFRDGYYVSGATVGAFGGRRLPLPGGYYVTGEARATLSWARVPVVNGNADVPDFALHASVGLGWVRGGEPPPDP